MSKMHTLRVCWFLSELKVPRGKTAITYQPSELLVTTAHRIGIHNYRIAHPWQWHGKWKKALFEPKTKVEQTIIKIIIPMLGIRWLPNHSIMRQLYLYAYTCSQIADIWPITQKKTTGVCLIWTRVLFYENPKIPLQENNHNPKTHHPGTWGCRIADH